MCGSGNTGASTSTAAVADDMNGAPKRKSCKKKCNNLHKICKTGARTSTITVADDMNGARKRKPCKTICETMKKVCKTGASTSTAAVAVADDMNEAPKRKISDFSLPLRVGTLVMCRWGDDEYKPVQVIERRKIPFSGDEDYEYYVHFTKFNRRLDKWVKLDQLVLEKPKKQKTDEGKHEEYDEHKGLNPKDLKKHEEWTKVRNVEKIEMGKYEIDTWYLSPFPPGFRDCSKLFFCEFCLNFMQRKEQLQRHLTKCELRHPPGNEIYRNGSISVFEVDGGKEMIYGQNLCYLAKLFLDHKTLQFAVDIFLFYVLCETDDRGCHMVGYFSKEKQSDVGNNLACILTLPPYQQKGYGKFMIAFSYELSKREKKVGSPEKPLSDLGYISYSRYWVRVLLGIMKEQVDPISICDLSEMTGITIEDVVETLQKFDEPAAGPKVILYKNGQHFLCGDPEVLDIHLKQAGSAGLALDPNKIVWTPYIE